MMSRKHRKTTDLTLTIADRLKMVIGNTLGILNEDILPSKRFEADFGADSLDMLDVVAAAENEFDIEISFEGAQTYRTVGDLLSHIEAQLGAVQE